jgi:long-chain acyl-CoA synthetase
MHAQATVCLAESIDTVRANLSETCPTWITAVPRFYEKVWTSVEHYPLEERKKELHNIFGPRIRWLSSGGAPLPRHICEGFIEAGLLLLEGYGLTESSPVISFNRRDFHKIGTVGQAIPGVEIKIADDGEILTRGPHVMRGYWRNPEATAETIVDGWLRTGDVGHIDEDGFLSITDRKKDLIITSSGKNIAPSILERLLISDPCIDQAVIYGDGRPFLTALIVPNFENLEGVARQLGCGLRIVGDLIENEPILAYMAERVQNALANVSRTEQVKKFLLLGRPFQVDAEELTATLKVRRRQIIRKFEDRLSALYAPEAAETKS